MASGALIGFIEGSGKSISAAWARGQGHADAISAAAIRMTPANGMNEKLRIGA